MFDTLIGITIFLFGAIIGSFLNVVAIRYRSGRTLGGRSMCMGCGKTLTAFELVPIASYITQRGRCTGCKTPISPQYALVEVITGFLFVFLYYRFGYLLLRTPLLFVILYLYYALLTCVLIVLSVYDIRHKILPDGLTVLFASITFIGMFFLFPAGTPRPLMDVIAFHIPAWTQFIAGIVLPAPFAALWFFSKGKWMGLGDAKLMVGMGFLLGISAGAAAIMFAFWMGALYGVVLLLIAAFSSGKKATLQMAVPFGPFLALGTILIFLLQINFDSILGAIRSII